MNISIFPSTRRDHDDLGDRDLHNKYEHIKYCITETTVFQNENSPESLHTIEFLMKKSNFTFLASI